LTLRVTDDDGASASDTVVVVVNPPPPPTSVHVGDLEGASDANKSAWTAQITVTVHDANHQSVSDAVVTGTWSGGASGSGTCTTDTGGACVVVSSGMRKRIATATFTVGGVTVSGHSYNAGQNHDADGDSNGTAMTVAKP